MTEIYLYFLFVFRAEASAVKLAELNPYVSIKALTSPLDDSTDLQYLTQYQVVILTLVMLKTLRCHAHFELSVS